MTTLAVTGGATKHQGRTVVSLTQSGVVTPGVAGRRLKVYVYSMQSRNDGMTVQLTDGNGGANLVHLWSFNSREGAAPPATVPTAFIFATSQGNPIYAVVTGNGTIDLDLSFWDDDSS